MVTRALAAIGMAATMLIAGPVSCGGAAFSPAVEVPEGYERIQVGDRWFVLEVVDDPMSRQLGLGGRESIPEDGGMLFVFPDAALRSFVMRDCPIPIDILFLSPTGTITAMHAMTPEPPQGQNESDFAYEQRLEKYGSRAAAMFAIELKGGTLEALELSVGDKIDFDHNGLSLQAR